MHRANQFPWSKDELEGRLGDAVRAYWKARTRQSKKNAKANGKPIRAGGVLAGQHLNKLLDLLCEIARAAGYQESEILRGSGMELPGYFRPQKRWDLVIHRQGRLCAAVELKSQVGAFGNNFNNRTEEAIGSSTDFWTAFREGALGPHQPWLGYFFLLEEAEKSTKPVSLKKGVMPTLPIFQGTSYADRYAILCERLILERKYSCASLIMSRRSSRTFCEPKEHLGFYAFAKSLYSHLIGCG